MHRLKSVAGNAIKACILTPSNHYEDIWTDDFITRSSQDVNKISISKARWINMLNTTKVIVKIYKAAET